MTKFLKKYWWALALVVVLWVFRIQLATAIYKLTGGKVRLFGVTGGSV